jgi:hypothetical protein
MSEFLQEVKYSGLELVSTQNSQPKRSMDITNGSGSISSSKLGYFTSQDSSGNFGREDA